MTDHAAVFWDAEGRRKIEAYDAARAQVKREGYSRAEYVLRAEAAEDRITALETALTETEAERDELREALRYIIDFQEKARAAPIHHSTTRTEPYNQKEES